MRVNLLKALMQMLGKDSALGIPFCGILFGLNQTTAWIVRPSAGMLIYSEDA